MGVGDPVFGGLNLVQQLLDRLEALDGHGRVDRWRCGEVSGDRLSLPQPSTGPRLDRASAGQFEVSPQGFQTDGPPHGAFSPASMRTASRFSGGTRGHS